MNCDKCGGEYNNCDCLLSDSEIEARDNTGYWKKFWENPVFIIPKQSDSEE